MEVKPIQFNDFQALSNAINRLEMAVNSNNDDVSSSTPLQPFNRMAKAVNAFNKHSPIEASMLVGIGLANMKEDWHDIKAAVKQFSGQKLPYDYKNYQTPFSTFRGTLFEKGVNKLGKAGVVLHKLDKTMLDTAFGDKMMNIFEGSIEDIINTGRKVPQITLDKLTGKTAIKDINVKTVKIGGKITGKFVGRTLSRMPLIGVGIMTMTEMPKIFRVVGESKTTVDKIINGTAQTLKSGVNVACSWTGGAMGGAALTMMGLGPFGSLTGLGLGASMGTKVANKINEKIDALSKDIKAIFE